MLETQYQMLLLHWHALCGALRARRNGEEGMATIEVLAVTAGLVLVAGILYAILKNSANNESKSLP